MRYCNSCKNPLIKIIGDSEVFDKEKLRYIKSSNEYEACSKCKYAWVINIDDTECFKLCPKSFKKLLKEKLFNLIKKI